MDTGYTKKGEPGGGVEKMAATGKPERELDTFNASLFQVGGSQRSSVVVKGKIHEKTERPESKPTSQKSKSEA